MSKLLKLERAAYKRNSDTFKEEKNGLKVEYSLLTFITISCNNKITKNIID